MSAEPGLDRTAIKACCAAIYGSELARLLVGEVMHPGGIALTVRLGARLGLEPRDRVLDVAAGRGVSARALAGRFGCQVVGIDLSDTNVAAARRDTAGGERIEFDVGDAESLDFDDGEFDAVICECAFCTFPDKKRAAREMARVVKPGGRVGIADLVRRGELPAALQTLSAWVACIADARTESEYLAHLQQAGFVELSLELHDHALAELAKQVRLRLLTAAIFERFGKLELPAGALASAVELVREAEQAISTGSLGYVLISASRT